MMSFKLSALGITLRLYVSRSEAPTPSLAPGAGMNVKQILTAPPSWMDLHTVTTVSSLPDAQVWYRPS